VSVAVVEAACLFAWLFAACLAVLHQTVGLKHLLTACRYTAAGGLGLPTSTTSQGMSPPSVSRLFGRRSRHQRRSSGAWFPSAVVQGSAASQQRPSAAGASGGAGSALPPQSSSFVSARQPFLGEAGGAAGTGTSGGTTARGSDGSGQQQAQTAVLQQALLSLKVIVAAGTVCAFHVGGGLESAADDAAGLPVSAACAENSEAGMSCCACALGSSLACACPALTKGPFPFHVAAVGILHR
jgi:hypothetical protein